MAPASTKTNASARPRPLQSSKSFSRFEPADSPLTTPRNRASTLQTPPPTINEIYASPEREGRRHTSDVFEKRTLTEDDETATDSKDSPVIPDHFDELPIELASLTDRFVESLSAKTFSEPPTIEVISDLFQEFYPKAYSHISTHISTLASRLNRSTTASTATLKAKATTLRSKASRDALESVEKASSDQQLLTASEVAEKRKARRLLELKQVALEEAVERRACEKIYDKIWRHKSTLDEVRDEKLRSKQASLALVGIGLKDLGIEVGDRAENGEETVREWLAPARDQLAQMDLDHYPLGKLKHLEAAHRSIVETLSKFHSSSSSADEILPTLIYTLITCPPEGINIISNLYFIERFRASGKIDGEAAYCMTNLEAAISFLENVDLSSLRADEAPTGPAKSPAHPNSQPAEKLEPFPSLPPSMPALSSEATTETSESSASGTSLKPSTTPSVPTHSRRVSNPFQLPSKVIGAANDAVRNTAEEVSKNISNTLDNSFKFLFGRLKEHSEDKSNVDVILPKTLDEARRLVDPPAEDTGITSETSSVADPSNDSPEAKKPEEKLLGLIGGRKPSATRDRSVDSTQSGGSGRRITFATNTSSSNLSSTSKSTPATTTPNAFDSMKNLGNSFNPLAHLSGIGGGLRGFGANKFGATIGGVTGTTQEKDRMEVPKQLKETIKFDAPIQRFLDIKEAGDLKLSDVSELLQDYQRLATVLKQIKTANE